MTAPCCDPAVCNSAPSAAHLTSPGRTHWRWACYQRFPQVSSDDRRSHTSKVDKTYRFDRLTGTLPSELTGTIKRADWRSACLQPSTAPRVVTQSGKSIFQVPDRVAYEEALFEAHGVDVVPSEGDWERSKDLERVLDPAPEEPGL